MATRGNMADDHHLMFCPGCGAPLSLQVEDGNASDTGFLICDHGHIFDLDDPDDDRALRASMGADYRRQLADHAPLH